MFRSALQRRRLLPIQGRLLLPLLTVIALAVTVPVVFPGRAHGFYALMIAYVVPPAGKETIIPLAAAAGYSPLLTATYMAAFDAAVAWILAWNWDLLIALPWLGPRLDRFMTAASSRLSARPRRLRTAFWGLALFVFLPFQGTGAFSATVLGRLFGVGPNTTWLAVITGNTLSAYAIALAAFGITALPPALKWSVLGSMGAAAILQGLYVLWKRRRTAT